MIEILDRNSILKINRTFKSFIISLQDVLYNPLKNKEDYLDDLEYFNELLQEYDEKRDISKTSNINGKYCGNSKFYLIEKDINKYIDLLSISIERLSQELKWNSILFLYVYSTPWLNNSENDYPPVVKAMKSLKTIVKNEGFTGGIKANNKELKEFIRTLFWINRCNAFMPDIYFCGEKSKTIGSICKYGILHFEYYSSKEKDKVMKKIPLLGFNEVKGNTCFNIFDTSSSIEGRKILI